VAQRWNCCTFSFAFISAPKLVLLARFGAFCIPKNEENPLLERVM
jgi:hypothetical protein